MDQERWAKYSATFTAIKRFQDW